MKIILKSVLIIIIVILVFIIPLSILIKTKSAQKKMVGFVERVLSKKLGLNVEIVGLNIALPRVLTIQEMSLQDLTGEVMSVKNIDITLIPSVMLFWKTQICNIKANEIRLLKKIDYSVLLNTGYKTKFLFIPNFIIKKINISTLVLDKRLIGQTNDIVLSVDSHTTFNNNTESIDFSLIGKLVLSNVTCHNNQFELVGKYDLKKDIIDLRSVIFNLPILSMVGNLLIDIPHNKLFGDIKCNVPDITHVLPINSHGLSGSIIGEINLTGSINAPVAKISGHLDVRLTSYNHVKYNPILFNSNFCITSERVVGTVNCVDKKMIVNSDIKYSNKKLYLTTRVRAENSDLLHTADLIFDTTTKLIVGDACLSFKNIQENSIFFPVIKIGAADLNIKYSSSDNISQQVRIHGQIKQLTTKIGFYGQIDIDFDIIDLWSICFGNSRLYIRFYNNKDIFLQEIKFTLHSCASVYKLDSYVVSVYPYTVNLTLSSNIKKDIVSHEWIVNITNLFRMFQEVRCAQEVNLYVSIGSDTLFKINNLKIGNDIIYFYSILNHANCYTKVIIQNMLISSISNILSDTFFDHGLINAHSTFSSTKNNHKVEMYISLQNIVLRTQDNILSIQVSSRYKKDQMLFDIECMTQSQELAR